MHCQHVKNGAFLFLWSSIRTALLPAVEGLVTVTDEPGDWRVETHEGRPFLTLRIQRRHVGLYLLPMYYHPGVCDAALVPFRHGKSTFRFTLTTEPPFEALKTTMERAKAVVGVY